MKKIITMILVGAFVLHAGFALAVSTMHVGEMSTGTFTQSEFLWNNDELRSITDVVGMELASGSEEAVADSVYLILGIAGATSTDLTISSTTNSFGTVTQGIGAISYGLSQVWTATDGTNAYQEIGLGTQASQNWHNWTDAYADLMGTTAPTSFGLFAYELEDTGFDGSAMAIDFNQDLEIGTFVLGFATFGTKDYVAPFTETGFVKQSPVPEPSSILLLGSGLLGLGWYGRKRKKA